MDLTNLIQAYTLCINRFPQSNLGDKMSRVLSLNVVCSYGPSTIPVGINLFMFAIVLLIARHWSSARSRYVCVCDVCVCSSFLIVYKNTNMMVFFFPFINYYEREIKLYHLYLLSLHSDDKYLIINFGVITNAPYINPLLIIPIVLNLELRRTLQKKCSRETSRKTISFCFN